MHMKTSVIEGNANSNQPLILILKYENQWSIVCSLYLSLDRQQYQEMREKLLST